MVVEVPDGRTKTVSALSVPWIVRLILVGAKESATLATVFLRGTSDIVFVTVCGNGLLVSVTLMVMFSAITESVAD